MYLTQIKFIDMQNSILDDGKIPELRKAVGVLEAELKGVKGKTEKDEKTRGILKKAVEEALGTLRADEKEFADSLKEWNRTGKFRFKKKVYTDYKNRANRPKDYLQWNRYSAHNDFMEVRDWEAQWGYELVKAVNDPYWPEGLKPNAEGHFRYGDCILMKIPFLNYLMKRVESISRSEIGLKDRLAKFKSDVEKSGGEVPEEIIGEVMDKYGL